LSAGLVQNEPTLSSLVWLEGNFEGDSFAAYSSPNVGARSWYMPYTDQRDSFLTHVAVQNIGNTTVQITLTYHDLTGTLGTHLDTIDPESMALYSAGVLPTEFTGGVVVNSDRPVVAITVIAGRLVLDKELKLPILLRLE
jgi:hypothetical protein